MAQKGILAWVNQVDRAGATLSAGSARSNQPVVNLADPQVNPSKAWWTAGTVTESHFVVDFGAAVPVRVLALMGCSFADSDTVRHRLSAVAAGDGELLDTTAVASDVAEGYGLHLHLLDAEVSARWWRCDIDAASLAGDPGYFRVGRAFAGPCWQFARNWAWGLADLWEDDSRVTPGEKSGTEYVDQGPRYRVVEFGLPGMTAADKAQARELQRVAGRSGQLLFVPFPDGDWPTEAIFGRVQQPRPIETRGVAVNATALRIRQSL